VKRRLAGSLTAGIAVAAILVAFEAKYRRAGLAGAAARTIAHGGHETVASILTAGFVSVTVIVAGVVFGTWTVLAHRHARIGDRRPDARHVIPR
jgi:hypothetical protein